MKNRKSIFSHKIELPDLRELRKSSSNDERIRCNCGKFLGNSNLGGSNGKLNDAGRGECHCENCVCKEALP